jgi:hypothetical protein
MFGKHPIDVKLESAFSGSVGIDGEGYLEEFFNTGDALLMIKEHAIYKFQLADHIDPNRTNIDIPHVQQKLYSVGTHCSMVFSASRHVQPGFEDSVAIIAFPKEGRQHHTSNLLCHEHARNFGFCRLSKIKRSEPSASPQTWALRLGGLLCRY